jgi:hypothetical protein
MCLFIWKLAHTIVILLLQRDDYAKKLAFLLTNAYLLNSSLDKHQNPFEGYNLILPKVDL